MRILFAQLKGKEFTEGPREYVSEESIRAQAEKALNLAEELEAEIAVFPEMCYLPDLEARYAALSEKALVVAGSFYDNCGSNTTIVFQNGHKTELPKLFPSPHEPMFATQARPSEPTGVLASWELALESGNLPPYFFEIEDSAGNKKHAAVLNCMDYYKLGYFVARNPILSKRLLLMISPCSNNNMQLFIEESQAIHNHNGRIYSLVVNFDAELNEESYAIGESYLFGMTDSYSQSLRREKGEARRHPASVFHLKKGAFAVYAETADDFLSFKRSDRYTKNPGRLEVFPLA